MDWGLPICCVFLSWVWEAPARSGDHGLLPVPFRWHGFLFLGLEGREKRGDGARRLVCSFLRCGGWAVDLSFCFFSMEGSL
ncbi:uncharacterized protein B0H64DRAFT_401482 [Chaetomium fimeti]|uniref:Secreted protein n=1 Tax=Chaetomium fimeti TaxID=1854472 RepID=A0AAE0LS20_9PEZI|nr:hypothetical protein B0H64DRAFT_401482 [Chaetomium fimeti]